MNECEGSKEILLLIIKMCHFLLRFLELNSQSKKKSWLKQCFSKGTLQPAKLLHSLIDFEE